MPAIPHCNADKRVSLVRRLKEKSNIQEVDTGEQSAFSETKSSARREQAGIIGDQAHECATYSPGNHGGGKPQRWSSELHHQVGWNFGGNIERIKDG